MTAANIVAGRGLVQCGFIFNPLESTEPSGEKVRPGTGRETGLGHTGNTFFDKGAFFKLHGLHVTFNPGPYRHILGARGGTDHFHAQDHILHVGLCYTNSQRRHFARRFVE